MEDVIKIVQSLEDSGLLLKVVRETIQRVAKEQKENLSGNNLADTGMNRSAEIFLRTG